MSDDRRIGDIYPPQTTYAAMVYPGHFAEMDQAIQHDFRHAKAAIKKMVDRSCLTLTGTRIDGIERDEFLAMRWLVEMCEVAYPDLRRDRV